MTETELEFELKLQEVEKAYCEYRCNWWNIKLWNDYLYNSKEIDCLHLPTLNKYLNEWNDDYSYDVKTIFRRCEECLQFIYRLDFALLAALNATKKEVILWKEGIKNIKDTISRKLDFLSFMLLKDAEKYLNPKTENMEYCTHNSDEGQCIVIICLWANIYRPVRKHGMSILGFNFNLPQDIIVEDCAVRLMHTLFDHTNATPCIKENLTQENANFPAVSKEKFEMDLETKQRIQDSVNATEKVIAKKAINKSNSDTNKNILDRIQKGRKPSFENKEILKYSEDITKSTVDSNTQLKSERKLESWEDEDSESNEFDPFNLSSPLEEPEVQIVDYNEYFIVGGNFHFDLLVLPDLTAYRENFTYISKQVPHLRRIHYKRKIIPPQSKETDTSYIHSVYEKHRFQKELSSAIFVQLKLPQTVIFLETPEPARFFIDKGGFSKDFIFDSKFSKEEMHVSFKTNQFGIFGILQRRYQNLPYKKWFLKGGKDVKLILCGKYIELEITISNEGYSVRSPNIEKYEIISKITGPWMFVEQLVEKLQNVGINIEINKNSEKFINTFTKMFELEDAIYDCFGLFSEFCSFTSFNHMVVSEDEILIEFNFIDEKYGNKIVVSGNGVKELDTEKANKTHFAKQCKQEDNIDLQKEVLTSKSVNIDEQSISIDENAANIDQSPKFDDFYNFMVGIMNEKGMESVTSSDVCMIENVRTLLKICRPISSMK